MHIGILSAGAGWHVQDLLRAAAQRGHQAEAIDFRKLHATVGSHKGSLAGVDSVLVRTMPPGSLEQIVFRMDVLHRLQAEGRLVLNPPAALETCIDKYLSLDKLSDAGLSVPATIVCQDSDTAMEAYDSLDRDVVVKPLFGSEGRGMVRISDPELAWRTFRAIERTGAVIYSQKFIPHVGYDVRAFMLGGRVIAAMRRYSNGDWRTNVAQGARAEAARLTSDEESLANRAASAVGAAIAGVDLLPGKDGRLYVLEVNAVPGWRALSAATGIDIAGSVVDYLMNQKHLDNPGSS